MQINIKTPGTEEEVTALRPLFEDYLKCTYWAERVLAQAFERTLKHISSKDFVRMMTLHTINTKMHSDRLEKIFKSIGIQPEERKFDAIESLISDLDSIVDQTDIGAVRDAALIAIVQLIIHCEIATYGTLKSFAISLKEEDVVTLLEKNLEDEKNLDLKLSVIAEAYINDEAANKEI